MLRITANMESGSVVRLRLDGSISVESYADLAAAFRRYAVSASQTIILDMAGVEYINTEPARQLAKLRGDHLRIINCSPFIVALLESVERQGTGE